ncbi:UDP-N-acetylmuramate--L-alanine ligase [Desulfonatronum thiosulfatophilum]|uniref:UDP-N-acetylmuramate--L-alanine ligase n=1 Tax=Desulfonatronum thiosulfatophilum TaxID=617002 RepID=A0A1G6AN95_9BACT|nr:UDP-N-acetylmuramate--L-alanine ligase [Desulfonatronum thiosulfatophilum]SDB09837.1 UDP-N-acetylmuramate--L-alanine ligase [Desulfonatronum thiosulfatophilum]
MKSKVKSIHMVGLGGSGMSGIAEVLLNLGYEVSGSDLATGPVLDHLRSLGAITSVGHSRGNLGRAQVLVKSTAVRDDNPEVQEARERGIPVIPRAEMLAELMRLRTGIAVAGTHGKTTTTSLLATIFMEAGLDPTVIIGGRLRSYGSNALLGQGEYLIAEADESDGSFLCLFPIISVVTNIDADHLDFYPDLATIKSAFVQFMNKIPFYGLNVVCGDDPGVQDVLPQVRRPVVTYGFGQDNDVRGVPLRNHPGNHFQIFWRGQPWGEVNLGHPGRHNVLNALGAVGVAIEAGLPRDAVLRGLKNFGGVGRRFEIKGEGGGVTVVDDYGHHPKEIVATIQTALEYFPGRRLVVLFQPHRFTRTKALFGDFCRAFEGVQQLLLLEIYPASEAPLPGISGISLAQGIRQVSKTPVTFFPDMEKAGAALPKILRPGDVLLTLGAGSVWQVGQSYLEAV